MKTRQAWERRIFALTTDKSGTLSMNRETYDDFVGSFPAPIAEVPRDDRVTFHVATFKLAVDDALDGDEIAFIPAEKRA